MFIDFETLKRTGLWATVFVLTCFVVIYIALSLMAEMTTLKGVTAPVEVKAKTACDRVLNYADRYGWTSDIEADKYYSSRTGETSIFTISMTNPQHELSDIEITSDSEGLVYRYDGEICKLREIKDLIRKYSANR